MHRAGRLPTKYRPGKGTTPAESRRRELGRLVLIDVLDIYALPGYDGADGMLRNICGGADPTTLQRTPLTGVHNKLTSASPTVLRPHQISTIISLTLSTPFIAPTHFRYQPHPGQRRLEQLASGPAGREPGWFQRMLSGRTLGWGLWAGKVSAEHGALPCTRNSTRRRRGVFLKQVSCTLWV